MRDEYGADWEMLLVSELWSDERVWVEYSIEQEKRHDEISSRRFLFRIIKA